MKEVTFDYHLKISFSQPVTNHRFTVRSFPVSDERQEILELHEKIFPNFFLEEGLDSFGNRCVYGSADEAHQLFEVEVKGKAKVGLSPYTQSLREYEAGVFRSPSKFTHMGPKLKELYDSIPIMRNECNLDKSRKIMEAVHGAIEYCSGSTNIYTNAEQALEGGRGVCQDYSHVMLALCRHAGIPCRYVVGMLIGEGASHAWVEIYDTKRWFGFDPTNLLEVTDSHIKLSSGRDYADCLLNRGIFSGGAGQTQDVTVKVEEILS
ncbi:MAG: transglutaminase domain-containing protein [Lachnospiraceae bacterium]